MGAGREEEGRGWKHPVRPANDVTINRGVPWAREAHSFKIHSVRSRSVPLVRLIIILSLLYNREREGGRERERE
jgi:hypothetical protein